MGLVEEDDSNTFRLPRPWQVVFAVLFLFQPLPLVLLSPLFGTLLFAVVALFLVAALPRYTVQLRQDGVKLYGLWWLPWTDVTAVTYWSLFGLQHFRVKRRRGLSWSIPLYFVGNRDLGQSLIHAAPPGNPFRLVSMRTSQ
jgi:hypothetical protein